MAGGTVTIGCYTRITASFPITSGPAGFVRWEIWDDTHGKKIWQTSQVTFDVYISTPTGANTLVIQAVGANDKVLDMHVWDIQS